MREYLPHLIEEKWASKWDEVVELKKNKDPKGEKKYVLVEFPYPSGAGLHVGHVWGYTMGDVIARYSRMRGKQVVFPMGWDAFGLPTENYAIKTGIHPNKLTKTNISNFKRQMRMAGFSFDWEREIDTTDPSYYKWTQWIFIQLFKAGLAYKKEMPINWCPACKTGLANEEVVAGTHERCGNTVTKRMKEQWLLKITAYADRLIEDFDRVDYPEEIKQQQINWIGRSYGARVQFRLTNDLAQQIEVFTTRPDTLPGVTFIALSPEYWRLSTLGGYRHDPAVDRYIDQAFTGSDIDRSREGREKTGVFTGLYAEHPITAQPVPIWLADYVLMNYGTGAVMGVPAHDERDQEFARKYGLAQVEVSDLGQEACTRVLKQLEEKAQGYVAVEYKMRDWIFSRQRYWGEPIPVIKCRTCGLVPVAESDLPVILPDLKDFAPTEEGESPLRKLVDWIRVDCPNCRSQAERETDTMPNWAGSSWYFLRYCDPANSQSFAAREKLEELLPVDLYIGGGEHTTLHLLYSRFWHKFLFDQGFAPGPEPYQRRINRGIILSGDGRKMSKSLGNVVNPDEEIKNVGADTLRMYELFIGPLNGTFAWNPRSQKGVYRFLERFCRLSYAVATAETDRTSVLLQTSLHKLIKKVTADIENLKFNTAVAAVMEFLKEVELHKADEITTSDWSKYLLLLAPFAPFLTEELWQELYANKDAAFQSVHEQSWPIFDAGLIEERVITIPIQVDGKLRGTLEVQSDESHEKSFILAEARKLSRVSSYLANRPVSREVFIPGRLVNFVTNTTPQP